MAASSFSDSNIWLIILLAGVGTYLLRLSFIALFDRISEVPPWWKRVLELIPPSVLAALIFPGILVLDGSLVLSLGNERIIAGVLAAIVAWRTESFLATVGIGMAALLVLQMVG